MPAYNFNAQFAGPVKSRLKRQTIRAKRKTRPRAGQTAYCFRGLRTKAVRRLGAWPIVAVVDVMLTAQGVWLNGRQYPDVHLDKFARADGFGSWAAMRTWFAREHGLPFHGDLIMW